MMKQAVLTAEEILGIVQSVVKQSSHPNPSPATLERLEATAKKIEDIEEIIRSHAIDETTILKNIQESVFNIITDQNQKHAFIEMQLNELKPFNDGITAAKVLDKVVKYVFGFIIGAAAIITAYKQFLK